MKWLRYLLLAFPVFTTCNEMRMRKYGLYVENNTTHRISFYVGSVLLDHVYPDTALEIARVPMQIIPPGEQRVWDISYPFEEFFEELPADTLSVFLFNTDTLDAYDWSVIRSQYKVLKRYDLSLQDLQLNNFIIRYP